MTQEQEKPKPQRGCRDECDAMIDEDNIEQWFRGEITGRYRCPKCYHALRAVDEKTPAEAGEGPPKKPVS